MGSGGGVGRWRKGIYGNWKLEGGSWKLVDLVVSGSLERFGGLNECGWRVGGLGSGKWNGCEKWTVAGGVEGGG